MTRKMTVGAAAAAFFGTILAASAASGVVGVAWNAETTNSWFDAGISSMDDGGIPTPGEWTAPTSGTASVESGTVVFDTDVGDALKYTPTQGSGPVALVNVKMVVDPNASDPTTDGLSEAQAALSVVTNSTGDAGVHWVGLKSNGSGSCEWVVLSDGASGPTVGAIYDVQIAVDNHASGSKWIRYAVKPEGDTEYTILKAGGEGDGWLPNPQSAKSSVAKVAFAGAGTIKSLVGTNIAEVAMSITSSAFDNAASYDLTNGTITAVLSVPSGEYDGKTAVLTITNLTSGSSQEFGPVNLTGPTVELNLNLDAGASYSYVVAIKSGGEELAVKSGTFVSATWPSDDDCLFGAKFVGVSAFETNGTWQGAAIGSGKWEIVTNAQFVVDEAAKTAATLGVTRVETSYSFETFIDTDSLETLPDAVGGIVAVSNGSDVAWYAYTGAGGTNGWHKLAGDLVPAANSEYVVRAEFNFMSNPKCVSYAVSNDSGATFSSLLLDGEVMISLASQSETALSSVGMSGKGFVKSICAKLANGAVAEDSEGNKFQTLWQALREGSGDIKLNTNATLTPTGVTGGKFKFNADSHNVIFDGSALPKSETWKFFEKEGVWYLMKPAATYIFF